jgi:hypothetical protein
VARQALLGQTRPSRGAPSARRGLPSRSRGVPSGKWGSTPDDSWSTPDAGVGTPPHPWNTPPDGGTSLLGGGNTPRRPWSTPDAGVGTPPRPWNTPDEMGRASGGRKARLTGVNAPFSPRNRLPRAKTARFSARRPEASPFREMHRAVAPRPFAERGVDDGHAMAARSPLDLIKPGVER